MLRHFLSDIGEYEEHYLEAKQNYFENLVAEQSLPYRIF